MRKVAILFLGLLVFAIGCGRSQTYTAPDGSNVKVEGSGQNVTVTTGQGTTTTTTTTQIDVEKTFGIPPYPGAAQMASTVHDAKAGAEKAAVVHLTTADPVDKVAAFYKEKFPKANVTQAGDANSQTVVMVIEAGGGHQSIMVSGSGGTTNIQISKTSTHGPGDGHNH